MTDVLALLKKAGINFEALKTKGINSVDFSDYVTSSGKIIIRNSGLILNEDLKWIVFHGGFDFGYLI